MIAQAEFLAALAFFSGAYAVAFSLLFLRKAGPGGVGGFLVFGGACSGFAAGIGGFGLLGACFAGVSRLGEDEGELESAAYCTCVQGSMSTRSTLLLEHHLKELKLPTFLREYRKLATQCAAEGTDHPDYLLRLAELELIDRHQRMVQRRIRAAHFPATKSLDTFDFLAIPSLNKPLVMQLARCEYIEHRENVIAIGNSGTGKTHVALGLGLAAC